MRAQLANNHANSLGELAAVADAIWAQYGGKFPTAAAEITVAAATADSHWGHSPSPHHPNNKGGKNHGCSKSHHDGGRGRNGSRAQTPGWCDSYKEEWCWYHNKWAPESVWKTLRERESHRKNQVRIARIFAGGGRGGLHNCALALGAVPMLL